MGKAMHPEANVSFTLVEAQLDGIGRPVRMDLDSGSSEAIPLLVRPSPETCISSSIDIAHYLADQKYWKLIPPGHENEILELLQQRHIFEEDVILLSYARTPFDRHPFACDIVTHLRRVTYRNNYEYRVVLPERLKLPQSDTDAKSAQVELYQAERRIRSWLAQVYMLWCRYRQNGHRVWLLGHHGTALDAHVAALIHRLVEISRLDLIPADLVDWANTMFKLPVWQQISKGAGTMGWVGRKPTLESTSIPDPNKVSPLGAVGSGRGKRQVESFTLECG